MELGDPRACLETDVPSTMTRAAPETANWPKCIMCQSWALPSTELCWAIDETAMRLARVKSLSLMGEKR